MTIMTFLHSCTHSHNRSNQLLLSREWTDFENINILAESRSDWNTGRLRQEDQLGESCHVIIRLFVNKGLN